LPHLIETESFFEFFLLDPYECTLVAIINCKSIFFIREPSVMIAYQFNLSTNDKQWLLPLIVDNVNS
tara:strand:- start:581 stop:781 length:201 start_codon:yes stop_codon:yes gene_type:complete